MMYHVEMFKNVVQFLGDLSDEDRGKISGAIYAMRIGAFQKVQTKLIHSPIRELIVKKYRLTFVIKGGNIYFLTGFVKKTAKTPEKEKKRAIRMHSLLE